MPADLGGCAEQDRRTLAIAFVGPCVGEPLDRKRNGPTVVAASRVAQASQMEAHRRVVVPAQGGDEPERGERGGGALDRS